jgi:hypothetical protein
MEKYDLVKITILNNDKKKNELDGRMIKKEKNYYVLAMGRLGKYNYHIHDNNKKIHWGSDFETPTYDINLLKHDILLKLDINKKNIDYKLIKRQNNLNLNDNITIKLLNKTLSLNDNIDYVLKIPNITSGITCKIININLWEPATELEYNKKIIKIIPGSFSVACGKYSKTTTSCIDTAPLYNSNDICSQLSHEIQNSDCIFNIHFRDIDLVYDITKI